MQHKEIKWVVLASVMIITLLSMLIDHTHINFEEPSKDKKTTVMAKVPNVTFDALEGKNVALHSLIGNTVWLHFWASWCVPCLEELPDLLTRLQTVDKNVILVAVSADAKPEDAKQFLSKLHLKLEPLLDSGRVRLAIDSKRTLIEGTFQTFQYPETIVIGPDLTMQRKIIGKFKQ